MPTSMLTRDEAQKLAQKVIGLCTFPECQVTIAASEQAYTRFANNGITTASLNLRHTVSIAVSRDGKSGVMTVNDLDDGSLRAAVKKAEELAAIAPANPERLPAPRSAAVSRGQRFRRAHRHRTLAGDDPARQDHHRSRPQAEAGGCRTHRALAPHQRDRQQGRAFRLSRVGRFAAHHHHPDGRWLQFRMGGPALHQALRDR